MIVPSSQLIRFVPLNTAVPIGNLISESRSVTLVHPVNPPVASSTGLSTVGSNRVFTVRVPELGPLGAATAGEPGASNAAKQMSVVIADVRIQGLLGSLSSPEVSGIPRTGMRHKIPAD